MKINILTLFPKMFDQVLGDSILGKATQKGLLEFKAVNIRDYSTNKHSKADDYPFGGGAGMVMMAQPIFDSLEDLNAKGKKIIYMSPRGKIMDREKIEQLATEDELIILCGHYEGIDQRVIDYWNMEEISIGDYVLTGGEIPAMALIDSVSRLIPGVLASEESALEESIYSGLLEHPQYTQPRNFRDLEVPEVLTSGNHKKIHLWKFEKSLELTQKVRPDLLEKYIESYKKGEKTLTKDEEKIISVFLSRENKCD